MKILKSRIMNTSEQRRTSRTTGLETIRKGGDRQRERERHNWMEGTLFMALGMIVAN